MTTVHREPCGQGRGSEGAIETRYKNLRNNSNRRLFQLSSLFVRPLQTVILRMFFYLEKLHYHGIAVLP